MSPRLRTITAINRMGAGLDQLVEAWLGYSRPPVERVIRDARWRSDGAAAYCHRCGESVGPGEADRSGCGSCRGRPAPADSVVRLGPYEAPLRDWVLALKFERWEEMGLELGRRLGQAVLERGGLTGGRVLVVPAPMPRSRRLQRGIDHARVLATGMSEALGNAPVIPLLKKSSGPPQISRSATERRRRAGRGLVLRRWPGPGLGIVAGCDLVLVDDVRTTGGTLRATTRRLRRLRPARVVAAVVAVADERGRRPAAGAGRPDTKLGGLSKLG